MKKEIITFKEPKSPISEVFRTLRTNIQFMNTKRGLKSLLVTSTSPSEGKSWVSANLAVTFAQAGKKVILIDCDMRKGRQFSIFGVAPTPGLSNFLSGVNSNGEESNNNILSYIKETEVKNLYLIPAGNIPPNPSELLVSGLLPDAIDTLREVCDLIIFDGTPSDLVTDAVIVSRYVDTTLIVTAYKETKMDALEKVKKDIENVGGKIAGVVINKMPVTQKEYYSSYYYGSSNVTAQRTPKASNKAPIKKVSAKQEEQLRIERMKAETKNKAKEILKQNREETKPKTSSIYDFEKDEQASAKQVPIQTNSNNATSSEGLKSPEELIKQMNDYLEEEREKLKKGE